MRPGTAVALGVLVALILLAAILQLRSVPGG